MEIDDPYYNASNPLNFFFLSQSSKVSLLFFLCSYPYFHFKEFGNNHRPSRPLPLTTHPNTKTTSASGPASCSLLTARGGMPREHLWLPSASPRRAGRLPPSVPASPAGVKGRRPSCNSGRGGGWALQETK